MKKCNVEVNYNVMINRWVLLFGDKTVTLHVHIQLVKKQSQVGTVYSSKSDVVQFNGFARMCS